MNKRYVLLTSAKNEEKYITTLIESVAKQTCLPVIWHVTDDGSTDNTPSILKSQESKYPYIKVRLTAAKTERSFHSKDVAINAAVQEFNDQSFDYIGVLDADLSLEDDRYFEKLLQHFEEDSSLGIAGGWIYEPYGAGWKPRPSNSESSVPGGIQLFRKQCFDKIGGYTPLHLGGEDWLAEIKARKNGWKVCSFPSLTVYHYRPTASAQGKLLGAFRQGKMDASFGSTPMFELLKCIRRVFERPVLFGAILRFLGYSWWKVCRHKVIIDHDLHVFLKEYQQRKVYDALLQTRICRFFIKRRIFY